MPDWNTNPYKDIKINHDWKELIDAIKNLKSITSLFGFTPADVTRIPSNQPHKNRHICPNCKNEWRCKNEECEDDGSYYECPICSARRYDCNPDTRMSYPGAFAEWERNNI